MLAVLLVAATVALPAAQVEQDPSATPQVPALPAQPAQPTPPQPAPPEPAPSQAPGLPDLPQPPEVPDDLDTDVSFGIGVEDGRRQREAVSVGQDFTLAAGEFVREAVVIFGNATIDGDVGGDVVVILGTARLGATAVVGGDFVVVGGSATVQPGASVARDVVVVGGTLDAPPTFMPGGESVVVGSALLGRWVDGVVPYVSRGVVWGRVIVPDLPWVWGVVGFFFLVYLVLNLLFDGTVRAGAEVLVAKPLTAFGVGLLVLLLVGPVSLLLAVSVVGLIIFPFLVCALVAAAVLGKISVARWMGMSIVPQDSPDSRGQATRSFALGAALLVLAYMVPVFGILVWSLAGVLGLGAASLAFIAAYKGENPTPARPPVPPPMPFGPPGSEPSDGPASPGSAASDSAPPTEDRGVFQAAPQSSSLAAMPRAWFRDRLAAFVLDIILVAIVANLLDFDAGEIFLPLLLAYHVGFWTWKQTTVGGIICQLRLVRVDGTPLGFADALVRGLSSIFSLVVLFIGALWILRDPDHQAWHDKIAGTFVVKVPRNWPL